MEVSRPIASLFLFVLYVDLSEINTENLKLVFCQLTEVLALSSNRSLNKQLMKHRVKHTVLN